MTFLPKFPAHGQMAVVCGSPPAKRTRARFLEEDSDVVKWSADIFVSRFVAGLFGFTGIAAGAAAAAKVCSRFLSSCF